MHPTFPASAEIPEPANPHNEHVLLASVRAADKRFIESYLRKNGQTKVNQFYVCKHGDSLKDRVVTSLHLAVNLLNKDMVSFLLDQGADINSKRSGNQSVLNDCIQLESEAMLAYLIGKGVRLEGSPSPLHYACGGLWTEGVSQLLNAGCNVNGLSDDESRETVLHVLIKLNKPWSQKKAVIDVLLQKGIDSTIKNKHGLAPVHYAGRGNNKLICGDRVKYLVKYDNRNVNLRTRPEGCTPIHQAIAYNNKDLTEFLLDSGADTKIKGRVTNKDRLRSAAILSGCCTSPVDFW